MKHSEWPVTVAGDADGAVLADFWITYLWRDQAWIQMYFGHSSADGLSALQGPLRGLGMRRVNAGERALLQAHDGQIPVILVHQCVREGWNSTTPEAVRGAVPDAEHHADNLDGSWPPTWAGDQHEHVLGELWSTYQYTGQT